MKRRNVYKVMTSIGSELIVADSLEQALSHFRKRYAEKRALDTNYPVVQVYGIMFEHAVEIAD